MSQFYVQGSGGGGGGGTVTSFSFMNANGFSGVVTSATTTPRLTLSTTVGDNQVIYASGGALTGTGVGTAGQVLKSNGAGNAPSFQNGGTGTVTSFSFTDDNGFVGVVTNPTTTPDLTVSTDVADYNTVYALGGGILGAGPGTAGQVLTSNGALAAPTYQSVPTIYTDVTTAMSPYTVLLTDYYLSVDSTGGPVTINLPTSPPLTTRFVVKDRTGAARVSPITIQAIGGVTTIDYDTDFILVDSNESVELLYYTGNYEVF